MSFRCNWHIECQRKPYVEIFYEKEDGDHAWCYLCFWHYLYAKFRGDEFGYTKINTNREMLENIMEEIWDIQGDLIEIKEKLGIKSEYPDILKRLWDNPEDEVWNDEDGEKKNRKSDSKEDN